jgi:hypothetical protein
MNWTHETALDGGSDIRENLTRIQFHFRLKGVFFGVNLLLAFMIPMRI